VYQKQPFIPTDLSEPPQSTKGVCHGFQGRRSKKITFCVLNKTTRIVRTWLDLHTHSTHRQCTSPECLFLRDSPDTAVEGRGCCLQKSYEMYGLTRFIRTSVRVMTESSRIPNQDRWERNFLALAQYTQRTGHSRVPANHVELYEGRNTPIGAWVGYMRQRWRNGILNSHRVMKLESLAGWTWGPLRPGPATNTERDEQIVRLRSEGKSLQTIADQVGVSRQRVHQIAKRYEQ
jgi:hypothetical protein